MAEKSVLVCGGTRQQGISLVNGLVESGYDVTIANRHDRSSMFGGKVHQITLNRDDEESIRTGLAGKYYDIIIDTCAYSDVHVKTLLDNVNTDKYVQYSSNAVYNVLSWDIEEHNFNPKNFGPETFNPKNESLTTGNASYQNGKRKAESQIYNYQIPELIIRIPYVSGPNDSSSRIEWFVRKVIQGERFELRQDRLDRKFAMTHESESGKFVLFAVENNLNGIYNIASDGTVTITDIIARIEKATGKYAKFKFDVANRSHYNNVPEHSMNTNKAKKEGYCFMSIDDWLWDTIDYFVANRK